jgi:ubiquinone biosynthesis protein
MTIAPVDPTPADGPPDWAVGSFTEHPPWLVDPAAMSWQRSVPMVRWAVERGIPDMIRPRVLPPGLRVGRVLWHLGSAVGGWWLVEKRSGGSTSLAGISRRLRRAAEALGPTYIKLGQIISSGEGIFPEELVTEFKKCRDQVPPEPFDVVRGVVEEDLGGSMDLFFSSFEREPVAAASIAQVHRAVLVTGEPVVVKVQRPSVRRLVHQDVKILAWMAPFMVGRIPIAALANPPALVELFGETIAEELDFRLEAENMLDIARAFAELGQRGYVVPRPHPTLVTPRVLVMERFDGFAFDDVGAIEAAGISGEDVVRTGMIGFMEGAMFHGIFHGDLHGGNLLILPDGRIGLLDYGIVGRLDEKKRLAFLRLLVGASMNDVRGQLEAFRDLGGLPSDTDLDRMIVELDLEKPPPDMTQMTAEEITQELQQFVKALLGYGAKFPKELMLYVKNLVFLDGAIASLAPHLDLFAEIVTISTYFAERHGDRIAADVGIAEDEFEFDFTGIQASFGVDPAETESLTYEDLLERRAIIRERMQEHRGSRRRGRRHRP